VGVGVGENLTGRRSQELTGAKSSTTTATRAHRGLLLATLSGHATHSKNGSCIEREVHIF